MFLICLSLFLLFGTGPLSPEASERYGKPELGGNEETCPQVRVKEAAEGPMRNQIHEPAPGDHAPPQKGPGGSCPEHRCPLALDPSRRRRSSLFFVPDEEGHLRLFQQRKIFLLPSSRRGAVSPPEEDVLCQLSGLKR